MRIRWTPAAAADLDQIKDYLLGLVLDGQLSQDDKEEGERLAREYVVEHPEIMREGRKR